MNVLQLIADAVKDAKTAGNATSTGQAQNAELFNIVPIHAPNMKGGSYKTELTVVASKERTVKLTWWHAPDPRREPHTHPWPFVSTILSGGYTESVYALGENGVEFVETRTYKAGDQNHFPLFDDAGRRLAHTVDSVEPGTRTLMVCGESINQWGHFVDGQYNTTPNPDFFKNLCEINPHRRK